MYSCMYLHINTFLSVWILLCTPKQHMNLLCTRTCELTCENHARGENAASYTKWNRSKVAGIKGRQEDKREAHYWAAREGRSGSKSRHVVRFTVKHNNGTVTDFLNWAPTENLRVSLSSHAAPVSERSTCPPCAKSGRLMTCWFFSMKRSKVRTQVGWNNFAPTITVDSLSQDTLGIRFTLHIWNIHQLACRPFLLARIHVHLFNHHCMPTYVPGGMRESRTKSWSAMMESPGSNSHKRLDLCVSSLLEILPP